MARSSLFTGTVALLISAGVCTLAEARDSGVGKRGTTVGLGVVLTTKDGGQIFGFDVNQAGNDGLLASAQTVDGNGNMIVSVETFNTSTGKITKSFAKDFGTRNSYAVDAIVAGDVGLVTHFVTPHGTIFAKRKYEVLNPVSGKMFTGPWTSPLNDIDIQQVAPNQDTSTSLIYAIKLKQDDKPVLIVSDVAANTVSNVVKLDPNRFSLSNGPHLAQYTAANKAVFALSPDGGAVGGVNPQNFLIDPSTGAIQQFPGYNNGEFHAGYVNGLAVDPNTGVAATTTELNAQVEFYDLNAKKGITFTQLPCTGDTSQTNSGSNIAVDPVNKLFLVTDQFYCDGSQGSAIVVFDESGNIIESITGFNFAIGEPAPAIIPSKRMGWAFGGPDGFTQLQQFFY